MVARLQILAGELGRPLLGLCHLLRAVVQRQLLPAVEVGVIHGDDDAGVVITAWGLAVFLSVGSRAGQRKPSSVPSSGGGKGGVRRPQRAGSQCFARSRTIWATFACSSLSLLSCAALLVPAPEFGKPLLRGADVLQPRRYEAFFVRLRGLPPAERLAELRQHALLRPLHLFADRVVLQPLARPSIVWATFRRYFA